MTFDYKHSGYQSEFPLAFINVLKLNRSFMVMTTPGIKAMGGRSELCNISRRKRKSCNDTEL